MEEKERPQVGRAILFGVIGMVAFFICSFILYMGISFGFLFLYQIPVINRLLEGLFRVRGDDPVFFAMFLAAVISYSAITWAIHRFCDTRATEGLALRISGSLLLLISNASIVMDVMSGQPFVNMIFIGIAGIIMIIRGGNVKRDPNS